jgi:hypothetical protein
MPIFLRGNSDLGSEETLTQFLDQCSRAGLSRCPFAADNVSLTREKYDTLMRRLLIHPQGVFTYAATAEAVRRSLYSIHPLDGLPNWTALARLLQQLWLNEAPSSPSTGENLNVASFPTTPSGVFRPALDGSLHTAPTQEQKYSGIEQGFAVVCGESPDPRDPHSFGALANFSPARAGAMRPGWTWVDEPCSTWPGRAAHRYTGPWNRSATPILTVNTTYDPATPYRDAQAMTAQLVNAQLLTVDGYGHTALLNHSSCAAAHESTYLVRGVLPPPGTVCQQDTPPFTETAPSNTSAPTG